MSPRRRKKEDRDPASGRFRRISWPKRFGDLLGKLPDAGVVRISGYSIGTVRAERIRRGIAPTRPFRRIRWTRRRMEMLGTMPDAQVAERIGATATTVSIKRRLLGIPAYGDVPPAPASTIWTPRNVRLLGTATDKETARRLGVSGSVVAHARRLRHIPPFNPPKRRFVWTKARLALVGRLQDSEVARRLGISVPTVKVGLGLLEKRGKTAPAPSDVRSLLRTYGDYVLSSRFGIPKKEVRRLRHEHGIPGPDEPGWLTQEVASLLGKRKDRDVAAIAGISVETVRGVRSTLGIPALHPGRWTRGEDAAVGTAPDGEIAHRLGRTLVAVKARRRQLGRPPVVGVSKRLWRWTPEVVARLGKEPDSAIALALGIEASAVAKRRRRLGIPPHALIHRWSRADVALLRKLGNRDVARRVGVSVHAVKGQRRLRSIPNPKPWRS